MLSELSKMLLGTAGAGYIFQRKRALLGKLEELGNRQDGSRTGELSKIDIVRD